VIKLNVNKIAEITNSETITMPRNPKRITVKHGLYALPSIIILSPHGYIDVYYDEVSSESFDIVVVDPLMRDVKVTWYAYAKTG
jgi:endo-alpha-1,4-polygalactosaminidase (GH114 family)